MVYHNIQGEFHDNLPGFLGFGFLRKLAPTKTQQVTDKSSKHNGHTAWFTGINREWCQLRIILFILLSFCANYHLFRLPMVVSRRCFCHGPPLKYRVRYGRSKHRRRFCYPVSDTLVRTLLCWTLLLCGRQIRIHRSRHCRSVEWDNIDVFLPIIPDLVLPCLYCCCPFCTAYLFSYLSSIYLISTHLFFFPIVSLHCCCLDCPVSPPPYLLPYLSTVPVI